MPYHAFQHPTRIAVEHLIGHKKTYLNTTSGLPTFSVLFLLLSNNIEHFIDSFLDNVTHLLLEIAK